MIQIAVPGNPEPPYSLAITLKSEGVKVKVPVKLENIALAAETTQNAEKEDPNEQ